MSSPLFRQSWSDFFAINGLCRETFERFRSIVFHYYLQHNRDFSWRNEISPYRVLVSELMLQQTQTSRVAQKFDAFISKFPDFQSLFQAPFSEVLTVWKGLGYNRRAKYLHDISAIVTNEYNSELPADPEILVKFPGIGPATAASICVFCFNTPLPFIETNIRTVFIHFFFQKETGVEDRDIMMLVERTLDHERPRQWYYALMDYGVMLKKSVGNLNRRSKHYSRQSPFEGSDRQLRGRILQFLLDQQIIDEKDIAELLREPAERVARLLSALCDEGIIVRNGTSLSLD